MAHPLSVATSILCTSSYVLGPPNAARAAAMVGCPSPWIATRSPRSIRMELKPYLQQRGGREGKGQGGEGGTDIEGGRDGH